MVELNQEQSLLTDFAWIGRSFLAGAGIVYLLPQCGSCQTLARRTFFALGTLAFLLSSGGYLFSDDQHVEQISQLSICVSLGAMMGFCFANRLLSERIVAAPLAAAPPLWGS